MKREHSKKVMAIVAGVLAIMIVAGTSVIAASKKRTETIDVHYNDIKIVVDGVTINPTDVNGNIVEPFIYNGTTYLPVRAVGNAFGKYVDWDGVNKVVYLGAIPGQSENWMSQCKPYQYTSGDEHLFADNKHFIMSGKKYSDGFLLGWNNPEALFNLDGKYNKLSFSVGHIDNTDNDNCTLEIWLDGKIAFTTELKYDDVAKKVSIPLNGALQMKIKLTDKDYYAQYGFSEGKFE